jgi:hypothetical protein
LLLMRTGSGLLRKRSSTGTDQANEVSVLRDEVEKLGARIDVLEQYIQQMQSESTEETPYNRAIQMARLGRDVSRISESCGISRGEAELIVSMHGPRE